MFIQFNTVIQLNQSYVLYTVIQMIFTIENIIILSFKPINR